MSHTAPGPGGVGAARSQLAGVIASLVFGGIVFLLGRQSPLRQVLGPERPGPALDRGPGSKQDLDLERASSALRPGSKLAWPMTSAIAILITGFFVFALDSFIFGVIAGEKICARAWTETMIAAGLLGIGALGIFTGLAWLLREHDEAEATALPDHDHGGPFSSPSPRGTTSMTYSRCRRNPDGKGECGHPHSPFTS